MTGGVGVRLRLPAGVREIALIAVLFVLYKTGRLVTGEEMQRALDGARPSGSSSGSCTCPNEAALQQAVLPHEGLVQASNAYYAWAHFPVTAGALLWAWWRDRLAYLWIRRATVILTLGALVLHVAAPLAPPRMLSSMGFVDTGLVYGQSVYATDSALAGMANQLAAMPSLHVGWAAVVALAVVTISRSRWRFLVLLHPVITSLVVVVTANHWWLDGIVSVGMLAVAVTLVRPVAAPSEVEGFCRRREVALG
jgi:hypothetical protein